MPFGDSVLVREFLQITGQVISSFVLEYLLLKMTLCNLDGFFLPICAQYCDLPDQSMLIKLCGARYIWNPGAGPRKDASKATYSRIELSSP